MNRRRMVIGLGGIFTGLSSVFSTGAFSNVQTNRKLSLAIENDDQGYLRFGDTHAAGTNQMFATWRDGMIEFEIGEKDGLAGKGLGADSRYRFDNIFVVENQGTQAVSLYGKYSGEKVADIELLQSSPINNITGESSRIKPLTEANPSDRLEPGDKVLLGLAIDTTNTDTITIETSITITADTLSG